MANGDTKTGTTTYQPDGATGRVCTLSRAAVERERGYAASEARRWRESDGRYDESPAEAYEAEQHYLAEVRRLDGILACIDAGVPELPVDLYPKRARQAVAA
jgi:hypothetical protein